MVRIFSENTVNATYKRNKSLNELISLSLFPKTMKENICSIGKCNRRCDICHATKRKYKTRGTLTCNTKNIIYLITWKCFSKQYIGSATGFKERFRIHKSDTNTGKIRCGVGNHLLNVCKSAICKTEYLQVQLIKQVFAREGEDIDKILLESENYWQAKLFILTHGLNSINEWYAINRRGYRK